MFSETQNQFSGENAHKRNIVLPPPPLVHHRYAQSVVNSVCSQSMPVNKIHDPMNEFGKPRGSSETSTLNQYLAM